MQAPFQMFAKLKNTSTVAKTDHEEWKKHSVLKNSLLIIMLKNVLFSFCFDVW